MIPRNEFLDAVPDALRRFAPEWGLVLGSGLGEVAAGLEAGGALPFDAVAGLPMSGVAGHVGQIVWGFLGNRRVVVLQGRVHLYEGFEARDVTAGVRLLAACEVRRLVLTNAAGSLNPSFVPGSWMLLRDHLNLTGTTPLRGAPHFLDLTDCYSRELREEFSQAATGEGIALGEGVYAGLPGPQYETPAEIRMLRILGADAVGMSTVLEAIEARAQGLELAALSCVTNWAAGTTPAPLSHAEVLATGATATDALRRLLARVLAA